MPKTSSSSAATTAKVTYVDVRFGERMGTMMRYRVPRLQTFRAGGKVAAMFVGYSAIRNAAVFAVAPSTKVSGVKCREVKNVCRYVDLPTGAHARLTLRGEDGKTVSRRLDVMRIRHLPKVAGSTASRADDDAARGEVPAEEPAGTLRVRSVDLHRRLCVRTRVSSPSSPSSEDGFTLAEVMVALTLLLIGVLALLVMIEGSLTSTGRTVAREQATNLARELIERSRAGAVRVDDHERGGRRDRGRAARDPDRDRRDLLGAADAT